MTGVSSRLRLGLVVLAVLSVACGADPAPTTTSAAAFPPVAVDRWLDALAAADAPAAGQAVEPVGASMVLAIENDLSDDQLAGLIEAGWPEELGDRFWASFREEFGAFSDVPIGDFTVGRHTPLDVEGATFALVRIDAGGDPGQVVTRRTDTGEWTVDLLATLGGAFAPLVFQRVTQLGDGPAADLIRSRMIDTVLPGLEAAAVAFPDDARLQIEIARIRRALDET
jgi:hypothetical protein